MNNTGNNYSSGIDTGMRRDHEHVSPQTRKFHDHLIRKQYGRDALILALLTPLAAAAAFALVLGLSWVAALLR